MVTGPLEPQIEGEVIRRNRELGQNFLIDKNLLPVITDGGELNKNDVVLEVGGGLGVLSTYIAPRAKHLHIVELDRRLKEPLDRALATFDNVQLHMGDALKVDLTKLDPPPNKMIANLPYGIAATLILKTIELLPQLDLWLVMVQKEVGQRFAATPGGSIYGAPSVLAQAACEVEIVRKVSRHVFRPVPNVDSVLLKLKRLPGSPQQSTSYRQLVRAAFLHRRKALARSYQLAHGGEKTKRAEMYQALEQLGLPSDIRGERLSPQQFYELEQALS